MNKLDNIELTSKQTGEILNWDIITSIQDEERKRYTREIFWKYENDQSKLTIEDVLYLKKLNKLSESVRLDFNKDKYFTVKNSLSFIKTISIHTRGVIYTTGHMITHDGRLKYGNNKLIEHFEDLRNHLGVSKKVWNTYVKKDIDEFEIIVKEKVNNKWCLLMNPIFAVKDRTVTETMFIAFHQSLNKYLHPIDYLYLKMKYNIEI